MLPILINYKVIRHRLTYWQIILSVIILFPLILQWRLQICIAIDNGSNNTVGGSSYPAHQAVSKCAEHNIHMVSCIHRKCQTRAGVSGDVNKTLKFVTITDSKFSNRVLVWMTPKSTSKNGVTIWREQLDFCLDWSKRELPDQLPTEFYLLNCFFNILII